MNIDDAVKKIDKRFPGFVITRINDWRDFWIFIIEPKNLSSGSYLDGCYSVNKKTGNVAYFIPNADPSYFKEAKQVR